MTSIRYLSGCVNPLTAEAAQQQPRLGMLAQPGNATHLRAPSYRCWGIDCGVFGKAARGVEWTEDDTDRYVGYLTEVVTSVGWTGLAFAVTPDVLRFVDDVPIGDAAATWVQSLPIFDRIRDLDIPAALVAQDGILDTGIDWTRFDALFIGGSDFFKLGPDGAEITRRAVAEGKWVHMGRVNSRKRLAYAASIGCDSADGTYIRFDPRTNLPKVLGWLDATAVTPLTLPFPEEEVA